MRHAVRRLTATGIEQFRSHLKKLREGGIAGTPYSLLTAPETSEPFTPQRFLDVHTFETRLGAARYLAEVFDGLSSLEDDVGLWSWLSLYYFDQVCPARPGGLRKPGRDYRHILEPGYRYGHRHLLGASFHVYRLHREEARLLLCTKVHQENMFHNEFASRQALISNPTILRAASLLYLDRRTLRPKRGAQDFKAVPGNLRRFVEVLHQLEINYDLYGMTPEALVDLLPAEFDEWRNERRASTAA